MLNSSSSSPDNNSYIDVSTADKLAVDTLYSLNWDDLTEEQKSKCLITATLTIDSSFTFVGEKVSETQPLEFPRLIDEVNSGIPYQLKIATLQLGLFLLNQLDSEGISYSDNIKKVKVSSIEVEFKGENDMPTATIPSYISSLLTLFVCSKPSIESVRVFRV